MMVRVGGGWDTLEHFLSRHEPCQVRLVTQGRRDVLPVTLPPSPSPSPADDRPAPRSRVTSASSKTSLSKEPSLAGTVSPVDSKASSISGKISPIERVDRTGKSSALDGRRTSTPAKPSSARSLRSGLTLPLTTESVDARQQKPSRTRKQSAPSSFSTPNTPTGRSVRTPPIEHRKSLTSTTLLNAPKKSRSMSLASVQKDEKKSFCGTDRLNQAKKTRGASAATTPTDTVAGAARKTRSQSLATTPVHDTKKFSTNGFAKKTRSMSLATPVEFRPINNKSVSVSVAGAMTQAAIEESIRQSLAASIADNNCSKKPFLHIKAKYRSPPPREVPPR